MSQALATITQSRRPVQNFRVGYDMPAREFESGADVLAASRAVYERMHPKQAPVVRAVAFHPGEKTTPIEFYVPGPPKRRRPHDSSKFDRPGYAGRRPKFRPKECRDIIAAVAKEHNVSVSQIMGFGRQRPIVTARYEVFYRLSTELKYSSPMVGHVIGGRDHSSILSGLKRRAERLAELAGASK